MSRNNKKQANYRAAWAVRSFLLVQKKGALYQQENDGLYTVVSELSLKCTSLDIFSDAVSYGKIKISYDVAGVC